MEIQSDLIVLPKSKHLPLPWSVRGPLGLESGAEVSVALVEASTQGLPDIIVTPLQPLYLNTTYTLDVELGERPGAVADFLAWLGDSIAEKQDNQVNIVVSETLTLEGRSKHKMHIVLEPAFERIIPYAEVQEIISEIKAAHPTDVTSAELSFTYNPGPTNLVLEQMAKVENGWLEYSGWHTKIIRDYSKLAPGYDLNRVVVSSNPNQRLLRFIIPKKGVIELRVPHRNRPGALREISRVLHSEGLNILSMRLSRTPPRGGSAQTSVFVAACEPLDSEVLGRKQEARLRRRLRKIDPKFGIDAVRLSRGKPAHATLFLTPKAREIVQIDREIAGMREAVRHEVSEIYAEKYKRRPGAFIFVSRRFIENTSRSREFYQEQAKCMERIVKAIEHTGCAVIEAPEPGARADFYDVHVFRSVYSRLWASDACLVLALNERGTGEISQSIAHEIGFFAGRNKPLKVFVSYARDTDPVFGNIVGINRITYPDGDAAFDDTQKDSLFMKVANWIRDIKTGDY